MNNDEARTYKIFGTQKYFMEVKLHNPDGDELVLNPQSIIQLVIEDDMHFWPIQGYFIYDNPYEILEKKLVNENEIGLMGMDGETKATLKAFKHYNFRNDGRDYLDITIYPVLEGTGDGILTITKLPDPTWKIQYKCVIYDKEDISVNDIASKMKKFYFWDVDYQKMIEKHVQWSTATSPNNPSMAVSTYVPSQATDNERKMLTGDAIKALLTENGFAVETIFDKGANKLFYSTFNDMNIWQNIEYLLSEHVSEKTTNVEPNNQSDICLFDKDRFTNKFSLLPFYQIFFKAGNDPHVPKEYQIEHLYFETIGDMSVASNKAPLLETPDSSVDVKINRIKKYQFVDMSAADNTHLLATTPVHSYNFKTKTFSINMQNSNLNSLEDRMGRSYIQRNLLTKNGPHPILTLNQSKTKNDKIIPVYSPRPTEASVTKKGLGSLLYASLFLNLGLRVQLEGATIRRSGRFVGIDNMTSSDNKFDYRLCGQWFITNVKHIFYKNMYSNELIGVKMHSYDDLNISSTVT